MHSSLLGPPKAVCYGEVSTVVGVCDKRFSCILSGCGQYGLQEQDERSSTNVPMGIDLIALHQVLEP